MRLSATKSLTYNAAILTGTGLNFMVYKQLGLPYPHKTTQTAQPKA